MPPANGHSGTSQPANGIDGRVNVLEKDHAVTRTQLESLTGSVATLGKEFTALKGEVTHGFSRLESLVVRADANSKSFGKFTIGQALALTSPAVAVVGIVGALLMYVIRTEIGIERREREAQIMLEQERRESGDHRLRDALDFDGEGRPCPRVRKRAAPVALKPPVSTSSSSATNVPPSSRGRTSRRRPR